MTFVASKIFWLLVQPSSLVMLLITAGAILSAAKRHHRIGRRLLWAGILGLAAGGYSPLANLAVLPLEERFPVPAIEPGNQAWSAIVVLGGAEVGRVGAARGQLQLNEAAERITEGLRLAHLLPSAKLVFSGGAGFILQHEVPGAEHVAAFWRASGIAADRIVVEARSLTTWENAVETHRLLAPRPGERFLLVTSAMHMPRSVGAFRRIGFDVTAYPCDFRTAGSGDATRLFDAFPAGFRRLDDTAKEWIGLLAYRLVGRSSALYPAP